MYTPNAHRLEHPMNVTSPGEGMQRQRLGPNYRDRNGSGDGDRDRDIHRHCIDTDTHIHLALSSFPLLFARVCLSRSVALFLSVYQYPSLSISLSLPSPLPLSRSLSLVSARQLAETHQNTHTHPLKPTFFSSSRARSVSTAIASSLSSNTSNEPPYAATISQQSDHQSFYTVNLADSRLFENFYRMRGER